MHRTLLILGAVTIILLTIGLYLFLSKPAEAPMVTDVPTATSTLLLPATSFTLEDRQVSLGDTLVAGTGLTLVTDLNADGRDDEVVVLAERSPGSGTFYYLAPALATDTQYEGGRGYYLGDRVEVTAVAPGPGGTIEISYLEREAGAPMSEPPTVPVVRLVKYDDESQTFVAAAAGASGGAVVPGDTETPAQALSGTRWQWVLATYEDGRTVTPKRPEAFVLTFAADGRFSVSTDCNGVGGAYTVDGDRLSFGEMLSTMMYCEGSDEGTFTTLLGDTASYQRTAAGELILGLKFDSGSVRFRPVE